MADGSLAFLSRDNIILKLRSILFSSSKNNQGSLDCVEAGAQPGANAMSSASVISVKDLEVTF